MLVGVGVGAISDLLTEVRPRIKEPVLKYMNVNVLFAEVVNVVLCVIYKSDTEEVI